MTYCQQCKLSGYNDYKRICETFVRATHDYCPELGKKIKIHLFLHLPDNMMDFGPTSSYNTERYIYICYTALCDEYKCAFMFYADVNHLMD